MVLIGGISSRHSLSRPGLFGIVFFSFSQATIEVVRAADAVVNSPFTSSISGCGLCGLKWPTEQPLKLFHERRQVTPALPESDWIYFLSP
jgi:hypothetical protein